MSDALVWVYDDGGREASGRAVSRWDAGDCVARAIAIATEQPYDTVYRALADFAAANGRRNGRALRRSARDGLPNAVVRKYLASVGWEWTPTMSIGSGTTVHLRRGELPSGRIIASVSKHVCAVVDGVIHDTANPGRDGTRCVYGYWRSPGGE